MGFPRNFFEMVRNLLVCQWMRAALTVPAYPVPIGALLATFRPSLFLGFTDCRTGPDGRAGALCESSQPEVAPLQKGAGDGNRRTAPCCCFVCCVRVLVLSVLRFC